MAMVRMRKGDAKSFNHWLRMRVVFQGLTIAAVCAGTYSFGLRRAPIPEQQGEEENVQLKEIPWNDIQARIAKWGLGRR